MKWFETPGPKPGQPEIHLNKRELVIILALVAGIDPERYVSNETKSLIFKVKALQEQAKEEGSKFWIWWDV